MRQQSSTKVDRVCEAWNEKHAVGSAVVVTKDQGERITTKTRSAASNLGGHTAVIWLEGITGCYDLSRVEAVNQ